ncbi:MAG: glycosyltransferase family 4 protein [Caldilineaceae bacterium]
MTFLGGLHYPPNAQGILWFAEHVFPQVLAQAPDAVLTVIGKQPPDELRKLGIPAANLEITGYVDDPLPYLRQTAAFLAPLFAAGGMRVKILDGWMWGLPIVSTTIGAEGIEIRPGDNILIADEAKSFAQAVLVLVQDEQERARIGRNGRRWLEQAYNWRTTYRAWDKRYPRTEHHEDPVYRTLHAEPDSRPAV